LAQGQDGVAFPVPRAVRQVKQAEIEPAVAIQQHEVSMHQAARVMERAGRPGSCRFDGDGQRHAEAPSHLIVCGVVRDLVRFERRQQNYLTDPVPPQFV